MQIEKKHNKSGQRNYDSQRRMKHKHQMRLNWIFIIHLLYTRIQAHAHYAYGYYYPVFKAIKVESILYIWLSQITSDSFSHFCCWNEIYYVTYKYGSVNCDGYNLPASQGMNEKNGILNHRFVCISPSSRLIAWNLIGVALVLSSWNQTSCLGVHQKKLYAFLEIGSFFWRTRNCLRNENIKPLIDIKK